MSAVGFGLTRRRWFPPAGKYPILLGIILVVGLFFGINVGKAAAAEQQDVYLSPSRK